MTAILEVHNLVKKYAAFTAVNGISFDLREGEIFSLLGPNGAGKTTTIALLSTLFAPTAGDALIAGHSVTREPMQVRELIGGVPQELALYDELTARENLSFWGQMYGLGGRAFQTRIAEILAQIGLEDRADQRVRTYSGGMKRRVNIGIGLLHKPRLLFMDEPTVGIDPQSRRAILDSVKVLNQQGMSVLYTTHYMEEAEELSDRIGIMDHGDMIALGTQSELRSQVGQNEALVLSVGEGDDVSALAAALGQLAGVLHAQGGDRKVTLIASAAEALIVPSITQANALGIKIRAVELQEPDLEAVFLHLTGRALRD
jgi:ABC-2 type transport system ATP-binding protein